MLSESRLLAASALTLSPRKAEIPSGTSLIYSHKAEISAWKFWRKTVTNNTVSGNSGSGNPMLWELRGERVKQLAEYASSPGHRGYCYAELAVFFLTVAVPIASTCCRRDKNLKLCYWMWPISQLWWWTVLEMYQKFEQTGVMTTSKWQQ